MATSSMATSTRSKDLKNAVDNLKWKLRTLHRKRDQAADEYMLAYEKRKRLTISEQQREKANWMEYIRQHEEMLRSLGREITSTKADLNSAQQELMRSLS